MPHKQLADSERNSVDEEAPLLRNEPVAPAPASSGDDVPIAQELPVAKLVVVMCSIWVGTFFSAVDGTVISTLLAPISDTFDSFATISWITTAYLIATAAVQPLAGKMTDIYGRRAGLLTANAVFGIGTLMCGVAQDEYTFMVGRMLAGGGGGGMTAISAIVASDLVPLRRRGLVQGGGNLAWGAGAALGGLYGGVISDRIGWRWAFLAQIPFIVVSATCVAIFVRIPIKRTEGARHRRIDYLGSLTLLSFLVLFLLALNSGGSLVPWNHPLVYVSLPVSFVLLLTFGYVEGKVAREPIIPLEILAHRTVLSACLSFFCMTIAAYCFYFFCPIYFMLRGESATGAGLRQVPYAIGISVGSLVAGVIMNHTGRYYLLGIVSMSIFALGIGLMSTFSMTTPTFSQFFYLAIFGAGYGAGLTAGLSGLIAAVAHAKQAVTTSASYLFRAAGSTIGAALGTAVFQTTLRKQLAAHLGDSETALQVIGKVTASFEEVFRLDPFWKERVVASYMDALHMVFWTSLVFSVLALFNIALVKEHTLHKSLDRK